MAAAPSVDEVVAGIRTGYTFDVPCLQVGAAVVDGTTYADAKVQIPLAMMNRHGLVAGATGTGKTKTLQGLAEQLSASGVPVFLADIKGDLSGVATAAQPSEALTKRAADIGQDWAPASYPTEFLILGGAGTGVPVRATMTSFGPILLSRVLGLNETQESSLQLVFHYADQQQLPLLDIKDLKAVVGFLTSAEGKDALAELGGLSKATAGVILRSLTAFEAKGMDTFFGEPELDTQDLIRSVPDGRGVITCLELSGVQSDPTLFSTFLMWLLADLFEVLPEVGDLDKPKMVFFFDEAHLLFTDASKAFLQAITQTVRLIRSKGVGVFFVTQTPKDVPGDVLAQLANRVQHALRAYTPDDAKALKATVSTFPISDYDLEELLPALGIGEAVVTVMNERGAPTPVAWTKMRAPQSLMAPSAPDVVQGIVTASPLQAKYGQAVDRESAYELLARRHAPAPAPAPAPGPEVTPGGVEVPRVPTGPEDGTMIDRALKDPKVRAAAVSAGVMLGRELIRGIFGTPRRRRR